MPINPMQRRARNSFLIGFLVALIIMAIVVLLLLNRIKALNEAKEALEALQSSVYVASTDLKSGVTLDFYSDFVTETVQTTVDPSTVISSDDFEFLDEDGVPMEIYNEDGTPKKRQMALKVDVPQGTIVTKDLLVEVGKETKDSDRILEYNMIVLPSTLKNGDFIDVRISLPTGEDFVVLSKKEVFGTNDTCVWLKVSEEEILIMNNAMVEAYIIQGAKLYATMYIEAGLQDALKETYYVSPDVMSMILKDPNILQEASQNIWNKYDPTYRQQIFETEIDKYRDRLNDLVEQQNNQEIEKIKAARKAYVEALAGTEDVGYER